MKKIIFFFILFVSTQNTNSMLVLRKTTPALFGPTPFAMQHSFKHQYKPTCNPQRMCGRIAREAPITHNVLLNLLNEPDKQNISNLDFYIKELKNYLKLGGNINKEVDQNGNTLLHYTFKLGFLELSEFLIANKANPNIKNHDGISPYDIIRSSSAS